MNQLTSEQKVEKAVQCVISYAGYVANYELGEQETSDVLFMAAARVWKCRALKEGKTPDQWTENAFAQYMRECVMEA